VIQKLLFILVSISVLPSYGRTLEHYEYSCWNPDRVLEITMDASADPAWKKTFIKIFNSDGTYSELEIKGVAGQPVVTRNNIYYRHFEWPTGVTGSMTLYRAFDSRESSPSAHLKLLIPYTANGENYTLTSENTFYCEGR